MSEVQRTTGYAPDLFDAHETNSANVKDKDAKVAYLTKILACVAIDAGEPAPIARPLKIVAGLEPERTNAFLQALATCAAKGDGSDAARRARRGETAAEKKNSFEHEAAPAEPRADRRDPLAGPSAGPTTSFDPFAGGSDAPRADAAAAGSQSLETPSLDVDAPSKSAKAGGATRPLSARRPPPRLKPEPPISPVSAAPTNGPNAFGDTIDGKKETNGARGGAILGEDDASDSSDDDAIVGDGLEGLDEDAGVNPWSAARGASGSPGASKAGGALVRDMLAAKREGDARAATTAEAGDGGRRGGGAGGSAAGGGGIILGSRRKKRAGGDNAGSGGGGGGGGAGGGGGVGSVDRIAGGLGADAFADDGGGVGGGGGGGEASARGRLDAARVREKVQRLVSSTNPLGKAMDALREDVESMRKELEFWRRERKSHARVIAEARRAAEDARGGEGGDRREREEAEETEAEIAAMKKRVDAARCAVARNDQKVAKLLAMVVVPA